MQKSWWSKQYVIIIAVIALLMVTAFLYKDSLLDTEKVHVDERLYNVGVLIDSTIYDAGWNQAHYEGFEEAAKELGVKIHYRTFVPDNDNEAIRIAGEELIEEGCREIFATSFGYGEGIIKLAQQHPDIYFFHCAGTETAPNVSVYFGRMYQARYLSGMAAGMRTKTNHIGFVAAMPIVEVIRGINAFTLGVQKVNPQAVVHVRWTDSWDTPEKEKEVTQKLLEDVPVDIVAYHQNSSQLLEVAQAMGAEGIGYHYDNREKFPDTMLTAAVWDWKQFYTKLIKECIDGRFTSRIYYSGLTNNVIKIIPPRAGTLSSQQIATIDSTRNAIMSGSWDVFYGPIYSQDGRLMVKEGEALSDKYLIQKMNWLVKGTEGSNDGTNN